jgi:hypothetical protein
VVGVYFDILEGDLLLEEHEENALDERAELNLFSLQLMTFRDFKCIPSQNKA